MLIVIDEHLSRRHRLGVPSGGDVAEDLDRPLEFQIPVRRIKLPPPVGEGPQLRTTGCFCRRQARAGTRSFDTTKSHSTSLRMWPRGVCASRRKVMSST